MVKSKVRFDGLDVAAMVAHWNKVALGRRVINIYNGPNGDTYLFKLDKKQQQSGDNNNNNSNSSNSNNTNLLLLIESGIRFHTTQQPYENPGMPSQFCSKLRKHLRGLRLEVVQQLGTFDRVVNLVFGSGDKQRHSLILELYARGNIILTNSQYKILSLLRSHEYENNNIQVKVGHAYPVTYATTTTTTTNSDTPDSITTTTDDDSNNNNNDNDNDNNQNNNSSKNNDILVSCDNPIEWYQSKVVAMEEEKNEATNSTTTTNKKNKKKKKDQKQGNNSHTAAWRNILMNPKSGVSHYGPSLIDHCLTCANIIPMPTTTTSNDTTTTTTTATTNNNTLQRLPQDLDEEGWKSLQSILQTEGQRILLELNDTRTNDDKKGYILYQPKNNNKEEGEGGTSGNKSSSSQQPPSQFNDKLLMEFQPHLLKQHENYPYILTYNSFDDAVDQFFSHLESQKMLIRAETQQAQAEARLTKIKQDQQQRIESLQEQQELLRNEAELVALHADMVDKAIQVVNSALDSGMDWDQLEDLVHVEQKQNHNPVALLIHQLELAEDAMVLKLTKEEYMYEAAAATTAEEEEGQQHISKTLNIRISLKETAHGNASALFARYRNSKEKSQKTIEASTKALTAAEETAQRQLQEAQKRKNTVATLGFKRKTLWFEKFHWFVTSDNYLVIAGRDAQQNEQLVKRYLRPGDAYLHADVHGAASCILRAKRRKRGQKGGTSSGTVALPLSDQALREAGNFTICKSSAWNSRMVTSAWWVESHQVSKTAPTGEYLTVGSFMVRGKKNFLPPTQLEMGLGVLFKLGDDDSIARHKNDRRDFALLQMEEDEVEAETMVEEEGHDKKKKNINPKNVVVGAKKKPTGATNDNDQNEQSNMPPLMEESSMTVEEKATDISAQNAGGSEEDGKEKAATINPEDSDDVLDGNPENDQSRSTQLGKEANQDEPIPDQTGDTQGDKDQGSQNGQGDGNADDGDDDKPEENTAPASEPPKAKKGLSVKERKLIRKYGSLEAAQAAEEERMKQQQQQPQRKESATLADKSKNSKDQQQQTNNNNGKRGKKSKMKRAAKKYADQDDEDRELALLALHAGEKSKKKDNKNKEPIISETEKEAAAQTVAILKKDPTKVAERLPEKVNEILAKCVAVKSNNDEDGVVTVRWDKFDADVLEQLEMMDQDEEKVAAAQRLLTLKESTRIDNFSASLAGIIRTIRKYGHTGLETSEAKNSGQSNDARRKTKAEKQAEEESWKQTLAEEGVVEDDLDDEDAIDDTIELSKLTGKPHNDDLLLFAVPVCAPYQTLSQYTYRVKLTPGNQKRGKASKQCVDLFLKDGQKSTPLSDRSKELIKKAGDSEWVQAISGDVKISAAGASKVIQKQKAKNKSKKKK